MPLQTSGPISLGDIQGEFGGSTPISITEYYGSDTGIPASGSISFSDFYGTSSNIPLALSNPSNLTPFGASDTIGGGVVDVTSNGVNVTASGGSPPYSYLWTRVGGSAQITADPPTSSNAVFKSTMPADETRISQFSCTVTDSVGATATSAQLEVTLTTFSSL